MQTHFASPPSGVEPSTPKASLAGSIILLVILWAMLFVVPLTTAQGTAPAPTLPVHVLHDFIAQANPMAPLVEGPDGDLYGVTPSGPGGAFEGTVFKMTPDGTFTTLVAFTDENAGHNGRNPAALVLGGDGRFYGTTFWGGSYGLGTVFTVTTNGTLSTLVHFDTRTGRTPTDLTLGGDGNFYGTTVSGGTDYDGAMFKVTTDGTWTTLANFPSGASPGNLTLGRDGSFYGVTWSGGQGTLFRGAPDGALTTLGSFSWGNGPRPTARLTLGNDGNLYGTQIEGGSSRAGTVFRVTTGGALTTLVNFNSTNGALPTGGLTLGGDGNFYGTTIYGGAFEGTVFKMTPDGTLTTLASFTSRLLGVRPYGGVTFGSDGSLYGTTITGGSGDCGVIFRVDLPPTIVSQPASQTNLVGSTATFTVTAFGTKPFGYQWLKDGTILADGSNVAGASTTTLTLTSVQLQGAGNFAVVVTNPAGAITSSEAMLVVFSDSDGDGVPDDQDLCPGTGPGAVVDHYGCSIEQFVPCAGPATGGTWRNHGQFLAALTATADAFLEAALITTEERATVVRAAGRSDCGR